MSDASKPQAGSVTDRKTVEDKAQEIYAASTANDPVIHCNRFPAWSELSEAARSEWRTMARSALDIT